MGEVVCEKSFGEVGLKLSPLCRIPADINQSFKNN